MKPEGPNPWLFAHNSGHNHRWTFSTRQARRWLTLKAWIRYVTRSLLASGLRTFFPRHPEAFGCPSSNRPLAASNGHFLPGAV